MKHQIVKRVCSLLFTFIFASPLNCMELPKNQKGHDTSLTLPVTQITDEESVMVERLAELLWETEQERKADLLKVLTIHEMINVESLDIKLNRKAREAGFEFDKLFGSELFQKAYDLFLNRIFQDEDQKISIFIPHTGSFTCPRWHHSGSLAEEKRELLLILQESETDSQ